MAREYTKEDLCSEKRVYANRLRTKVLEDFYENFLMCNAYIFRLSNGEIIHLVFNKDQFCHLLGFKYFNYNGIKGWHDLADINTILTNLPQFSKHKREEIRMVNFPKILEILNNPTIYIYINSNMRYSSDYFAIWSDGERYYKLGIVNGSHGINYGETYQVSLVNSYDNKEIQEDKRLLVEKKYVMPIKVFYENYYPKYKLKSIENKECEKLLMKYQI